MEDMTYDSLANISLEDIEVCANKIGFRPVIYSHEGEQYLLINFICDFEGKSIEDYWRFYKFPKDVAPSDQIHIDRYAKFKPISSFGIQYRPFSISYVMPLLESLLTKYGGWVETMYGDEMYELDNLDELRSIENKNRD